MGIIDELAAVQPISDILFDRYKKYDEKGNTIYERNLVCEHWYKYDENGNEVYWRRSYNGGVDDEHERWQEYDDKNRVIHCWTNGGHEWWCEYDKDGHRINISRKKIEEREFLSREPISRFELMDINEN